MTDQTNPQEAMARLIRWRDHGFFGTNSPYADVPVRDKQDAKDADVLALLSLVERITSCEDDGVDPRIAFLLRGANDALAAKARAEAERDALAALVEKQREALKPFAKAGELFAFRAAGEYDQSIYSPAAGPEYSICANDLRLARDVFTSVAPLAPKPAEARHG